MEKNPQKKKKKDEPERMSWRRGRAGGCGNHEDGSVTACVSAHMALAVFFVKLMKIKPFKALSAFCSGRRLLKETKTKSP